MGRRSAARELENRVRLVRQQREISQVQLAERAGLTRQAISSIESGHYIPITSVALRLAQVLHCRVEELFVLPPADTVPTLSIVAGGASGSRRLAVGRVGERWIGYPLAAGWEQQPGFPSADVVRAPTAGGASQLLTPLERLERTAIIFGCDPSLGILGAHLAAHTGEARLRWLSAGSQDALDAAARGEAHIAGAHLPDPDGG